MSHNTNLPTSQAEGTQGGPPYSAANNSAISKAWDDVQKRSAALPAFEQKVKDAYAALDDDRFYITTKDGKRMLNPQATQAYNAAAQHAAALEKAYYDEGQAIGVEWANVAKVTTDAQQNAAQMGLDAAKVQADVDQANRMAGFYQSQAANYQAQADQAQADAAYNAALREAYTPQEAADHQKRVDEAKIALDESNGRLNDANAAAQEAANGVAPELARAGLSIQQAKAASAGSQATIDAATAANAPAASAATTSSLRSQATIDAANAAVSAQAADAAIKAAVARGDLDAANAAEVMALLEGKKQYAQAQIEGQQAANAQTRLQTHQLQVGDVQTKIEQLGEAVKNGMHPAQADRLMEDYLSGSTPFQRQQQRETQLSGAMGQALSYGMGVLPGQQYLPGAEPGGAYDAAFSKLGVDLPNVQLSDARPLTSYVQAQGIQTQEQPAPSMFSVTGGYTPPAATAPTAVPAAPPPTAAGQPTSVSQPTHAAVPVVTTAQLLGPQQPTQTAAGGGTFGVPYVVSPYGGAGGSALGGWSGVYPPESEALPLSPLGTVPYPTVSPLAPEARNAAGGTTVVPRAMQGMLQQPKVDRIPIFAARKAERRPMFAGRA